MKRIISFILVLCLLLSVCGCKRKDPEATAAPLDITEGEIEKQPELPEDEPEKKQTQTDEQVKGDKAEPCNLTLENSFSQYEVIVTLTNEETAKKKEYTAKDFADYDVFYVLENDAYYGNPSFKDSYPEYQDKTTLVMYLNEPSKENVLNTVKALEKDERVFAACPCPFGSEGALKAYLNDDGKLKAEKYELELSDFDLENVVHAKHSRGVVKFTIEKNNENQDKTYTVFKKLINNPYVIKVVPIYPDFHNNIEISIDNSFYNPSIHNKETFEQFTDMNIINFEKSIDTKYSYSKELFIHFEKPTYQQLFDMVSKVKAYDANILIAVNASGAIVETISYAGDYILK